MEVISKDKIKKIFLECGVGKAYSEYAAEVCDCIALQLTGKNLGKGATLIALSLEDPNKIKIQDDKAWSNSMYPVVPYNDSLIVETVRQRYRKSQLWLLKTE